MDSSPSMASKRMTSRNMVSNSMDNSNTDNSNSMDSKTPTDSLKEPHSSTIPMESQVKGDNHSTANSIKPLHMGTSHNTAVSQAALRLALVSTSLHHMIKSLHTEPSL